MTQLTLSVAEPIDPATFEGAMSEFIARAEAADFERGALMLMAKAAFTNELKEVFIDDDPPCANVLLRWPSKEMNRLAQRRARASRVQPRKEIDMKAFLALALISIATIADARRGPVPQPVPGCHWVMRTNGSFYLVCG